MHLKEVGREFEGCEFVEGLVVQGFDPKGIFVSHLNFVGYTNISKIFVPQEIQENRSPKTVVSTNVKRMEHDKSKIRQRSQGESPSKAATQQYCSSCPSSTDRKMSLRKTIVVGDSNEGCPRGVDGEDPPQGKIEKSHALDHPPKRRKGQMSPNDLES